MKWSEPSLRANFVFSVFYGKTNRGVGKPTKKETPTTSSFFSAHGYRHVDAQVAVVGKELRDARVEDEAVRVEDGRGDALVD